MKKKVMKRPLPKAVRQQMGKPKIITFEEAVARASRVYERDCKRLGLIYRKPISCLCSKRLNVLTLRDFYNVELGRYRLEGLRFVRIS